MWSTLAVLLGSSALSAVVPLLNAEVLVLGAALLLGPELAIAVAITGALGQVGGKAVLYHGGRGLGRRASDRNGRAAAIADRFAKRPRALLFTCLVSAILGLPPFYLMALVAGIAGLHLGAFMAVGFVGRVARFYVIALAPVLI